MAIEIDLEIFSPRWGHEDTYKVVLNQGYMEITMQMRRSRATYDDSSDPIWSGETLDQIMNNDQIYPPEVTQDLFEHAWKAWRNGDLNDHEVADELKAVADWINATTRAKPRTEFWRKYF